MTYGLVDVVGQYFSGGWDQHWSNQLRLYNYKHMEVRPEIDAIWESMYKGISYVNNMLENLAKHDSTKFALYNVIKLRDWDYELSCILNFYVCSQRV